MPEPDIPFTAIDIETTGLHPFYSEILEVAAVRFNLKGRVFGEFSTLINPMKSIPPQATDIHGITNEMVQDKPVWNEIAPEFYNFVKESILCAHNAPFDLSFLTFKGTVIARPFPDTFFVDTLTISRELFSEFQRHTLVDLADTLDIELNQAHRALSDSKACMHLFLAAYEKFEGSWNEFAKLFVFHTAAWQTLDNIAEEMMPLIEACSAGFDIEIIYVDSEGVVTDRRITPLQLNRIRQVPYLFGHCHLRNAGRNFRLDRIQSWKRID
jgi:DNA polymerase III subunit epsilon